MASLRNDLNALGVKPSPRPGGHQQNGPLGLYPGTLGDGSDLVIRQPVSTHHLGEYQREAVEPIDIRCQID